MFPLGTRIKTCFASPKSLKIWEVLKHTMPYLICPCVIKNELGFIQQHFKYDGEDVYIVSVKLTGTGTPVLTVFQEEELINLN